MTPFKWWVQKKGKKQGNEKSDISWLTNYMECTTHVCIINVKEISKQVEGYAHLVKPGRIDRG